MGQCRYWIFLVAVVLGLALLPGCGSEQSGTEQGANAQASDSTIRLPDFATVVEAVSPAVVNITALPPARLDDRTDDDDDADQADDADEDSAQDLDAPHAPWEGFRYMPRPSRGSGFIISADGYILTSRHIVSEAGQVLVKLADHRQLDAEVVGTDEYSDIALLKIEADNLPVVTIGDPDQLSVGAWVLAIGSPFGFETSAAAGIVSAKGRNLASEQYVPFIQTDVAINPGNSGGPLFNPAGEVVGVNAQIYSRTGGSQGISFAIPADIAMHVAQQLKTDGAVTRGWLGAQVQNVDRDMASSFGLDRPLGALVTRVFADSPAERVGLQAGDIILSLNDETIVSASVLPPLVGPLQPGTVASLTVLRDGERQTLEVEVGALPEGMTGLDTLESSTEQSPERVDSQGLTLEFLTDEERDRLDTDDDIGVHVSAVEQGAGARAGLLPGDIILALDKHWITSPADFATRAARAEGPVALLIWRDGERLYLALRPERQDKDAEAAE